MVPGIREVFDRVDCALEASALGLPPAAAPKELPAVMHALPAGPIPGLAGSRSVSAEAGSVRADFLTGANLALLAAGTAATIYLWLRVFGPDVGAIALPSESASAAFGRTSVPAALDLSPEPEVRPQPESAVAGGGSQPATTAPAVPSAATEDGGRGGRLVSNRSQSKPKPRPARRTGGPAVRPSPPPPPPAPPGEPAPARAAPVPTIPVPSAPPEDRVPGPTLPGGGSSPAQPTLPGGGPARP
jgi:hypothetical protein